MPLFIASAVLLTVLAVIAVVWPLLRKESAAVSEAESNLALFREQKAELDAAAASGALALAERDAAVLELAGRLAEELPASPSQPTSSGFSPRLRRIVAVSMAVALPIASIALYLKLGTPAALKPEAAALAARGGPSEEEIVAMVDKLAARMAQKPDDPVGWRLLARSQAALGRLDAAVQSYEKAAALNPQDAELLADWADVLAVKQGGKLAGRPYEITLRALALDANLAKALALAASAELEADKLALARQHAVALLAQMPRDSDDARQVQALIDEIAARTRAAPAKRKP